MHASIDTLAPLLRARRLALGLSLDDLRRETRVPHRALASLEAGRLAELPAGPVTKGFAMSYARAVGVDVAEVHACWPSPPSLPTRASAPPVRSAWRWVVLLVLLLLPLWLLGRWLALEAPGDLGEAGQASWSAPSGSPDRVGAATLPA